jgi:hypothetical protein
MGTGSTYTVNMSGGTTGTALATGDYVFLMVDCSAGDSTAITPAPPTGFTQIFPWAAMGTSITSSVALWVKKRESGDSNYVISQTNTGRANQCYVRAFWIDGANIDDIANWVTGTVQSRAASGGTFSSIAPSVTTAHANSMAFGFGFERTSASETTSQLTVSGTGWTKQYAQLGHDVTFATITIASKAMATAGATGAVTFTNVNTQATNGMAFQLIIPPTPDAPPPAVAGKIWDGTSLIDGHWYLAGAGDTIDGTTWAGMMWPGYESISAMLAEDFFWCGHRGGSANYPEMSMQGYTQAVLRGYGALEVSLARSSDGVWFGLHDASLDRTSLGTGGGTGTTYVASSMTWATIQTHDALPGVGAPVNSLHQPYMALDDILDAYMDSHVLFIDPKSATSHRTELIGILKNRPNWAEKIVAKAVPGNSNNSFLSDARAAGFVTNAMFYDTDTFSSYQAQADILGMEYGATAPHWTAIKAYGKPVMCHVIPNSTALATGVGKGADGAIVSGIVQLPQITL